MDKVRKSIDAAYKLRTVGIPDKDREGSVPDQEAAFQRRYESERDVYAPQ